MQEHIYILDDHPIIAEGLAKLLTLDNKYKITIGKHYSELYNYGIIHFNLASLYITKIRKYVGSRALRPTFYYKFAE